MKLSAKNAKLNAAKMAKNDEFYTMYEDIAIEMKYYWHHLKGKVVYCNCDNPEWSNFWKYFYDNFHKIGIKKLVSTHYEWETFSYVLEYDGAEVIKTQLNGNGDFRNTECIELLKEADIVVTNPPFSLFREYMAQLIEYGKKFLIIGNKNAVTYKEIFPLIRNNQMWVGHRSMNSDFWLRVLDGQPYEKMVDGIPMKHIMACWFTNLDIAKSHESLVRELYREYDPVLYPKYDNYDAINVDKVADIPKDYFEAIGVPITFLDKYSPDEFEIIGKLKPLINGQYKYARLIVRRADRKEAAA